MNTAFKLGLGTLLLLAVAAGGYWFGTHATATGKPATSTSRIERTILYYRNPMGLPDTSPIPKKDSMGMDYVPVFQGDADPGSDGTINISVDKIQKLGVKSEAAIPRALNQTLRMTGRIEIDERRTYTIAPKFEGWVEHLYVNTTGQTVAKGQPLFDVYSPELVSAQREHTLAVQGLSALKDADDDAKQGMQQLASSSAARLKNWDISSAVPSGNEARPHITFRAPASGIVLEKKAVQGMRFMPGEMLYQIADLSSVWVIAEVPEQDIGQIRLGTHAQVTTDAYPERSFDGRVAFIYPTLNSGTRTVQVRMEIANAKGLLKPAMFANIQIATDKPGKVLAVPTSAVIDSGSRQVVLVRLAQGRFEPRAVKLGNRSDNYVEVQNGITAGEEVVTSANFLIDAESNLKAALSGMGEQSPSALPPARENALSPRERAWGEGQERKNSTGHQATGILESINTDGTVSITHEPIKSLGWPGMSMDFALTNSSLTTGIKPGSAISFELVERKPGEYVISRLQAQHGGH